MLLLLLFWSNSVAWFCFPSLLFIPHIYSHFLYFCLVYLYAVCCANICNDWFFLYVTWYIPLNLLHSWCLTDVPCLLYFLLLGLTHLQILGLTVFLRIYFFLSHLDGLFLKFIFKDLLNYCWESVWKIGSLRLMAPSIGTSSKTWLSMCA